MFQMACRVLFSYTFIPKTCLYSTENQKTCIIADCCVYSLSLLCRADSVSYSVWCLCVEIYLHSKNTSTLLSILCYSG